MKTRRQQHQKISHTKKNYKKEDSYESELLDDSSVDDVVSIEKVASVQLKFPRNEIEELLDVSYPPHRAMIHPPEEITQQLNALKKISDDKNKAKEAEKNRKLVKARERKKKQEAITGEDLLREFYHEVGSLLPRNFLKEWELKRLTLSKKSRTRFFVALTNSCTQLKDVTYQWIVGKWSIFYIDRRPTPSELLKTCHDGFVPVTPNQNAVDVLKKSLEGFLVNYIDRQDIIGEDPHEVAPTLPQVQPINQSLGLPVEHIDINFRQVVDRKWDVSCRIAKLIRETTSFENLVRTVCQAKDDEGLGYIMDKIDAVKAIINIIHGS